MDSQRWQTVKKHLDRLAEVDAQERSVLLENLRREDPPLGEEVAGFLSFDDEDDESFIEDPVWHLLPTTGAAGKPESAPVDRTRLEAGTDRIGPYRLLRLLGQGGMGQVHLAVREDDYEQKVAIKRTLGTLARRETAVRFENERQILADLQHPGIARLLDGGTDENGLPYLVMEYVEGEPITTYCDRNELDLVQRLRLFRKVCRTVHFAHQNLVVHRDLKPNNILVTEDGKPRLLDFGIAKLLEQSRDAGVTVGGNVPLTPACASPEQLMGETITTATDVYALGVLLYELLTGRKPYQVDGLEFAALIRQICLKDPPRPSLALGTRPEEDARDETDGTLSTGDPSFRSASPSAPSPAVESGDGAESPDGAELRRRRRALRGDLDAIVLKAMRKEPSHRYASASDLADDVLHYLKDLPVQARKGNWLYHTGKHLRRHRPALAALILILGFSVTSTVMWQLAEHREARAVAAEARSRAMLDFLTRLLSSADPNISKGEDLTVKEVVEQGPAAIESTLAQNPALQAEMYSTLAKILSNLGAAEASLEMRKKVVAKLREAGEESSLSLAIAVANLAKGYFNAADYRTAEQKYLESIAMRKQLGIPEASTARVVGNLASTRLQLGKFEAAEKDYQKVLRWELEAGASPARLYTAHHALGTLYKNIASYERAVDLLHEALEYGRLAYDPMHLGLASTLSALGESYLGLGKPDEALEALLECLAIRQKLLGDDNVEVAKTLKILARIQLAQGRTEAAERDIEHALRMIERARPEDHWLDANARSVRAEIALVRGNRGEAETILLESLESLQQLRAPCHAVLFAQGLLAEICRTAEDKSSARACRAELLSVDCRSPGRTAPPTYSSAK